MRMQVNRKLRFFFYYTILLGHNLGVPSYGNNSFYLTIYMETGKLKKANGPTRTRTRDIRRSKRASYPLGHGDMFSEEF